MNKKDRLALIKRGCDLYCDKRANDNNTPSYEIAWSVTQFLKRNEYPMSEEFYHKEWLRYLESKRENILRQADEKIKEAQKIKKTLEAENDS